MSKKTTKNRYKKEAVQKKGFRLRSTPLLCAVFVLAASFALIFLHDFVVQMDCFNVKSVVVEGNTRVAEKEIISLAEIGGDCSVLAVNLFTVEKRILTHPWIRNATLERKLPSGIRIRVNEQEPMAIVKIENLADILINKQGMPFKEYSPEIDKLHSLPVISGLELTRIRDRYLFKGRLFNSVFDILHQPSLTGIRRIKADKETGLTVTGKMEDTGNDTSPNPRPVELRLGFRHYAEKAELAEKIETYYENRFERRTISSIDLFNPYKKKKKTKWRNANCRETKT